MLYNMLWLKILKYERMGYYAFRRYQQATVSSRNTDKTVHRFNDNTGRGRYFGVRKLQY